MSIEQFKFLYRFFVIGFLPGLLFFLGFDYIGSMIFHPERFDIDGSFLKSFIVCFAVAFWMMWDRTRREKRRGIIRHYNISQGNLLTLSLLFIISNLLLFILLHFVFNIIVHKSPNFNSNFMLSVLINFFVLSVFVGVHYFKTRKNVHS